MSEASVERPRVGVSACLLGREVRMNGGHCRQRWLTDVLAHHVAWVPVCPEVEMGLPVPRPPMRLVAPEGGGAEAPRMVVTASGEDVTERIDTWSARRLDELAEDELDGFVLKKDSPSCGVFRVKVYDRHGSPSLRGRGRFAEALAARFPNLPVEEEGRLGDRGLRDAFLVRVFALARWRRYLREDGSPAGLVAFHAAHKYLLLAADPGEARALGARVAGAGRAQLPALQAEYEARCLRALARRPSRGRHVNVMQHLLGFLKRDLASGEKADLQEVLDLYVEGAVPRAVPLRLVRHLLRAHGAPAWAREQVYLRPYDERLHVDEAS